MSLLIMQNHGRKNIFYQRCQWRGSSTWFLQTEICPTWKSLSETSHVAQALPRRSAQQQKKETRLTAFTHLLLSAIRRLPATVYSSKPSDIPKSLSAERGWAKLAKGSHSRFLNQKGLLRSCSEVTLPRRRNCPAAFDLCRH